MSEAGGRVGRSVVATAIAVALLAALPVAGAGAQAPPLLWQSPQDGQLGSEGGRVERPGGIGMEPASPGHLFIADRGNSRIGEFDAWGQFERTWGWEVVASGPGEDPAVNERQRLTVDATGGDYVLRYFNVYGGGVFVYESPAIPHDAPASAVRAAFEAMEPSLGGGSSPFEPGDVQVSGGPGDEGGTSPYEIEFAGNFEDTAIPQLTADVSGLVVPVGRELTCEAPEEAAETTYRWLSDGAPATGPGASSDTYTTVAADEGSAVQCQAFKSNADGVGSTQASSPAQVVAPAPATPAPVAPAIAPPQPANPVQGTTLTCDGDEANWEGSPTLSFQWYRNGQEIPGATEDTYTLTAEDVEAPAALQCAVIGANAGGAVSALSRNRATGSPPGAPDPEAPGGNSGAFAVSVDNGAATVETLTEGGSFEICVPAAGDACQDGQGGGAGAGQFGVSGSGPGGGVAVDSAGDVYAFEAVSTSAGSNVRVQKFDNEGNFLLMWGGEVNKTSGADRCTAADLEAGEVCGAGVPGEGEGSFADVGASSPKIAVGPAGTVFVGDRERIQEFDAEGNFLGEVAVPGPVRAMAIDGEGNFHLSYAGENDVRKLSPAGEELESFPGRLPSAVAVGPGGEVYLVETPLFGLGDPRILAYDPDGECFVCAEDEFNGSADTDPAGLATSDACGIEGHDLYAAFNGGVVGEGFTRAHGPPPDPEVEGCEPPEVAPDIEDAYATSATTEGATLRAVINPQFWPDTRYYLEYGTGKCSEGGCTSTQPAPPGAILTETTTNQGIKSAAVALSGLAPDTTYHYRFVAASGGGGPVRGIGGTVEEDGAEGTFSTFPTPPGPSGGCANDALREGPAALLPDCRAYEMVTPAKKANGDVVVLTDANRDPIALNQSAADGNGLTYSAFRAFAESASAPASSQYLATRGAAGWTSEAINPPREPVFVELIQSLTNQFKAFSPDLCQAWVFQENPVLAPGGIEDFANLYRRDNCGAGAGSYEALTTIAPPNRSNQRYIPELVGVSADGGRAIFRAADALPGTGAPAGDPGQKGFHLYEAHGEGQLRYVCIRPGGTPVSGGCSAGSTPPAPKISYGRQLAVDNAISADGERIFWTDVPEGEGRLFVRIGGTSTEQISFVPAQYWTAASDGSVAIFTTGNLNEGEATLHRYDVDAKEDETIGSVYGVMGASEDAAQVYFASGQALGGESSEGAEALPGEPNLYRLDGEGEAHFIGTLAGRDARSRTGRYTPVHFEPTRHTAQVSPDGLAAAFMATAPLTGADSTDAASGEPDNEVFHYDARAGELRCVSCSPTGARPSGRELPGAGDAWAAAQIPTAQTQVYQVPKVLSDDGGRLFFESFSPLVANDTNGKADVYQWEAPGKGSCTASSPLHSQTAEGCVALISSGQSNSDAAILDASPSGEDVFFATARRLLPASDPDDLIDVYDARAGGGFAPPAPPPEPCEGEACQSPPPAPSAQTPSSSVYEGPGDLAPRRGAGRCARAARSARSASRRAKRLRRKAGRAARRAGKARRAKRMRHRSRRLARRAKRASRQAKRCRARARGRQRQPRRAR